MTRRLGALVAVTFALGALAACGGTADEDGSEVATLTGPGATTASPSPSWERPRYRLDMTAAEEDALLLPYFQCLEEHGYSFEEAKEAKDAGGGDAPADLRMCEERYYPLVAWERDPANPEAADFAEAVDSCLRERGLVLDADGRYPEDVPVAEAMELSATCERQVFEARK